MPRMNDRQTNPTPPEVDRGNRQIAKPAASIEDRTKNPAYQPAPQVIHRNPTPIYIKEGDIDLKLRVLDEKIAENFVPLDFNSNENIGGSPVSGLSDKAYVYVDDNGKPQKVLIASVREIDWENLTGPAQAKIQNMINQAVDNAKLIAGDNITITGRTISANIGVASLNEQTGNITLTAGDLNAYTKDVVYTKEETYSAEQVEAAIEDLIVDGGAYR